MTLSNRTNTFTPQATDRSPWGSARDRIERCEERLVLSALPLFDVAHHVIDEANEPFDTCTSAPSDLLNAPIAATTNPQLVPLASAAHNQTGWTDVQRLFGLRGEHQTVAVIDSGIAWDHVALGGGFGPGYRVVGGWDFAENEARPYDDAPSGYHGTHVSGIVGADDPTRSGVAPSVDLVALRVFDDNGKGQLNWTENALRWVHQNRNAFASPITTVNLSLGSTWNSGSVPSWGTFEDELLQLQQDGIVVVASAGNSFKQNNAPGLSYPAASPYVIPVAAIDANGQLSDFSQRHERVIAAPGRQITSTIPDHVLGSDGILNDWSVANGTSMASPYVAGSAVLIREAMEMVGRTAISPQEIYQWMSDTSDSIWDNATKATYDRLNLGRAIGNLLPSDNVGDSWSNANSIELQSSFTVNGWLNTLGDRDAFRFTADVDSVLDVSMQSKWLQGTSWSLWIDGHSVPLADASAAHLNLQAGHSYALALSDADQIGNYALHWSISPTHPSNGDGDSNSGGNLQPKITDLGDIDYREVSHLVGQAYSFEASHDGTLSIVVQADQAKSGVLEVRNNQGAVLCDAEIENGQWRIDVDAIAGSKWSVQLPNNMGNDAQLVLANVLHRSNSVLTIIGTEKADSLDIDLNQGPRMQFGKIAYSFNDSAIVKIGIDLGSDSDSVRVHGSSLAEKLDLQPEHSTIENQRIAIDLRSTEQIDFSGGGGPDRVYLYGSTGDDTLTARPRDVEWVGSGFQFQVDQIERTYVNAEQGGQDVAYFFDSVGDDRLSVRPQFSSMSGKDFFNYASGIERVYAYSNSGGIDSAVLYDSTSVDTFFTSGEVASIVGAGFFSYTRNFESVEAISAAGGKDIASIYASEGNSILVGSDFTGYQDVRWSRIARGFSSAKTFVDNQIVEIKSFGDPLSFQIDTASIDTNGTFAVQPWQLSTSEPHQRTEVESSTTSEHAPLNLVLLDDDNEERLIDNLDWLDPQLERQILDEIFAEHGAV